MNDNFPSRACALGVLVYEAVESRDYPDHWHVEATDTEGTVFIASFSGPTAQERAREFADRQNGGAEVCTGS
jgi:hypothetical protein